MFGLVVIILSVLLAIFAYFISPDPSPYANRIILEVARQKPGHRQMFLKVKKGKNVTSPGFFKQLLFGKEDKYYYVPITSSQTARDSIIVQKFIDEGLTERQSYRRFTNRSQGASRCKKILAGDRYLWQGYLKPVDRGCKS